MDRFSGNKISMELCALGTQLFRAHGRRDMTRLGVDCCNFAIATYCVMLHETAQRKNLDAVRNIPLYQPVVYGLCHYHWSSTTS